MNIRWTLQRERSSSQKDVVKCSTTFLKGSSFCGDFWELHIKIHNISHDTFLNKKQTTATSQREKIAFRARKERRGDFKSSSAFLPSRRRC